jgi:hypothetical protein
MQFHVLSFEGPDGYARAGGLASRVKGLTAALSELGFETHLWFVGDPQLPGHEVRGSLHLHRWCQWISSFHRGGVYDGEEGKQRDYAASLPPHLWKQALRAHLERGAHAARTRSPSTGISGEDYAVPGQNAIVLQTADPREFIGLFGRLRAKPGDEEALRRAGQRTSRSYAWREVLRRNLFPRLELAR